MSYAFRHFRTVRSIPCITWVAVALFLPLPVFSQTAACPAIAPHPETPADKAYSEGSYRKAEDLYGEALAKSPHDLQLSAALVHTWLHEGEISQASSQVNKSMAEDPHSAVMLTALAEVQLHQGQPWQALETLNQAATSDPCSARVHFVRSRALRFNSMYASERAEIQSAYDIDPADPDIRHAYLSTVNPAREIEGIDSALKTMKDLDPEARKKGQDSIDSMMPMLSENNQTCKVLPTADSAVLPLQPAFMDAKHLESYRLEVQFPKAKARLIVDTAASGMFISRALAELNGFESQAGDPPGTVRVDSAQIGPLEFHDCTVGVSDTPFAGKADGFIGTDMFASYLITLDQPGSKLTLAPLPKQASVLPGDRTVAPGLQDFTPVYHRMQFLLVPVMLNSKSRKLFALDTGIRISTMAPDVAHSVSNTKLNFTNSVQTTSGSTLQVYRDSFDFQFASLSLEHQAHILEMDPAAMERNTGIEIAGMLGFDMLHSLVMHLDYRDGLVKFDSPGTENLPGHGAKGQDECQPGDDVDRPVTSTLQAKVTGLLDSGHMKPGQQVVLTIVNEWQDPECTLSQKALLYGHVVASTSSKSPDSSELSLVFDHGDCDGHEKKALDFRVIGLVAPPDQFVGLQEALPSEVAGGGRGVSSMAAVAGFALTVDLNPGGTPHTVHPGIVAGIPDLKLEPMGGPGCSAKLTSTGRSIHLGVGAQLLLTRQASRIAAN
jgi:Tetratricopeptide repeat